ncbi:DNA polymerase III subunit delta' [Cohaesibacter celericrescens]|uniref:DNA polymerase III subunit delta n=1 Tax=Cohaesibacter celericrescens TaxID=2067669 RepID=A0A2N5XSW9_9HYPH|nr:DNA polymerase III subunit delta' [Cohaesibacter celericrescens]PLW77611.1 DNA polymerase III subunit delta' [Cohaesibacter celericrescens]
MAETDHEIPVFDALDNLAPPHQQHQFFGHEKVEKDLLSAWQTGKMHHAWLLTGPKGIGKATFAFRAARFIFNEGIQETPGLLGDHKPSNMDVRPDSHAARLTGNLAHPNLLVIDRPYDQKGKKYKTEITVDEVRKTVRFFGSTAGESTWRVCIVDPADELNSNAANALLKILEEPPKRTVFFLISHAPGRLLPTIRSRCRRLSMSPLENPQLSNAIASLDIAQGEIVSQLSEICDGSLRKAAELQSDDGLILVRAFERLLAPPFNPDYESLNAFADIVNQRGKEQRFAGFSDLVHRYLSHQLHHASRNTGATAKELYPLAQAWDKADEMIQQTRTFNLDKKQTTIDVMRMLAKASNGQ